LIRGPYFDALQSTKSNLDQSAAVSQNVARLEQSGTVLRNEPILYPPRGINPRARRNGKGVAKKKKARCGTSRTGPLRL